MLALRIPLYRRRVGRIALDTAACFALSALLVASALAQDATEKAAPLKLQLNKLEAAGEACRVTLVIDNSKGAGLKSYKSTSSPSTRRASRRSGWPSSSARSRRARPR